MLLILILIPIPVDENIDRYYALSIYIASQSVSPLTAVIVATSCIN